MKLRELLHSIIDVDFDVEIKGVTCNPRESRKVIFSFVSAQRMTLESRKPARVQILPTGSQYHAHDCVDVVIQGTKKMSSQCLTTWIQKI
nr:unnamed protein product [Callosobruchus chinensis]